MCSLDFQTCGKDPKTLQWGLVQLSGNPVPMATHLWSFNHPLSMDTYSSRFILNGKNLAMWKMFPIFATINREMFQNLKGFSFKKNEHLRMSSVSMLLSAPVIEHNTGRWPCPCVTSCNTKCRWMSPVSKLLRSPVSLGMWKNNRKFCLFDTDYSEDGIPVSHERSFWKGNNPT